MSEEIMQIPVSDLLESLKSGYEEYRGSINNSDDGDLGHIKGFCTTIEQILRAYGGVTADEIIKVKEPIIGNISLKRKKKSLDITEVDLELPSIYRREKK